MTAVSSEYEALTDGLLDVLVQDLNWWAPRMNRHFRLRITIPPIAVRPLSGGAYGIYEWRRGEERIVLDRGHLLNGRCCDVYTTEAHELFHAYQHQHGCPPEDEGTTRHHNEEFIRMARSMGLSVDSLGHTSLIRGETPFWNLMRAYGVDVTDGVSQGEVEIQGRVRRFASDSLPEIRATHGELLDAGLNRTVTGILRHLLLNRGDRYASLAASVAAGQASWQTQPDALQGRSEESGQLLGTITIPWSLAGDWGEHAG